MAPHHRVQMGMPMCGRSCSEARHDMGVRGRPVTWDHFYSTARWARLPRHQLLTHPLCAFCAERGFVVPASRPSTGPQNASCLAF